MKTALVVGGGRGIGLAIVDELLSRDYNYIYIVGMDAPDMDCGLKSNPNVFRQRTKFIHANLVNDDMSWLQEVGPIDTLIYTAGFGRVAPFEALEEREIINQVKVNELAAMRIIHRYYPQMLSDQKLNCAVMVSIAGHVASPLFSVYGATKSALAMFIQNLNAELDAAGKRNRILDISPGSLKGTSFNGGKSNLELLESLPGEIVDRMLRKETLFIPQYDQVYGRVIRNYREDPAEFARNSYRYKMEGGRLSDRPQGVVGYLSGTFDLFHVGHLNLLRRAKEQCDYLIVGVHKSGAWKGKETFIPFEERRQIVESICYVDKAVESFTEDSDAYDVFHYDKLFVGSDYKGTERFMRYEAYFQDKGVEIVYFPYTQGTSSTQLRERMKAEKSKT